MNNALFKTTKFINDNFVYKNGSTSRDRKQKIKFQFANKKRAHRRYTCRQYCPTAQILAVNTD